MTGQTYHFRFFDDYGSGWLWPGDDATRDAFGYGPADDQLAHLLRPDTLALSDDLSARHAASLNQDYPPDPCPWPLAERMAFDAEVERLFQMMQADLGARATLQDKRMILGAE